MTECNQEVFSFASHFSRRVKTSFTAGQVSTDGGALLLRQADGKIGLLKRVASCFSDRRSPLLVEHQLGEMLSQRIYGLAQSSSAYLCRGAKKRAPRSAGPSNPAEVLAGQAPAPGADFAAALRRE
jgi:hypothetical protein